MKPPVRFIKKGGRVIPIRLAGQNTEVARSGASLAAGAALSRIKKPRGAAPHLGYSAAATGLAAASGALGAATFFGGTRAAILGTVAGVGLDIASTTANLSAHALGGGSRRARIKSAARQEGINMLVGNGIFVGGILAQKKGREMAVRYGSKLASLARRALGFGG